MLPFTSSVLLGLLLLGVAGAADVAGVTPQCPVKMFTDRGCTKSDYTIHQHVASADACCAICSALRNNTSNPCRAFTYHPSAKTCATSPVTTVIYGKGKVSGTFDDPPAPPSPSPTPHPTPPGGFLPNIVLIL